MRKMKIFVVVCAVFFSLLNVNKSDGQESVLPNVLNIIVILDTSDRTRHPGQIERDIAIIKAIVTQFEKLLGNIFASANLFNILTVSNSLFQSNQTCVTQTITRL